MKQYSEELEKYNIPTKLGGEKTGYGTVNELTLKYIGRNGTEEEYNS